MVQCAFSHGIEGPTKSWQARFIPIANPAAEAFARLSTRDDDPRWVQDFLGHASITTTERYLHTKARPDDVERLNRAFAPGPGRSLAGSSHTP